MIEVEELERRMRPGAWSEVGFLGESERLEDVIEADRRTLSELELTADRLAEPLETLLGAANLGWLEAFDRHSSAAEDTSSMHAARQEMTMAVTAAEEVFGSVEPCELPLTALTGEKDVPPDSDYAKATIPGALVGGRFEVAEVFTCGSQECPWSPARRGVRRLCGSGSGEWLVRDRQRGLELKGPELIPHLMREHGFFEGFESPYRVDPRALAELLQLGPFAEATPLS